MNRELVARLSAEFTIIVLGVLVALAVDDWRAGQAEREREAYFIESLAEDLRSDISDFEAARVNAQRRMAAAAFVTSELGARQPVDEGLRGIGTDPASSFTPDPEVAPPPPDLTAALQQLAAVANFDFATGTYQEILSTGSFGVIRSATLRRRISQYYVYASDRSEADNRIRETLFHFYEALRTAGLAPGDDGELLRALPERDSEQLMAAIRIGWGLAAVQSMIAENLQADAQALIDALAQE